MSDNPFSRNGMLAAWGYCISYDYMRFKTGDDRLMVNLLVYFEIFHCGLKLYSLFMQMTNCIRMGIHLAELKVCC